MHVTPSLTNKGIQKVPPSLRDFGPTKWSLRLLLIVLTAGFLVCPMASTVDAKTINIILSDLDLIYNNQSGGAIYDMTGLPGGNMSPGESDPLQGAVFELDMTPISGSPFMNDMWGDFLLDGVGQLSKGLSFDTVGANTDDFGFQWFDDAGHFLKLNFEELDVAITDFVFLVTGTASSLDSQNLPGGLAFDPNQPIVVSYTATLPMTAGDPLEAVLASGAMTISGTLIPEPATLAMAAMVATGCLVSRRRRGSWLDQS